MGFLFAGCDSTRAELEQLVLPLRCASASSLAARTHVSPALKPLGEGWVPPWFWVCHKLIKKHSTKAGYTKKNTPDATLDQCNPLSLHTRTQRRWPNLISTKASYSCWCVLGG